MRCTRWSLLAFISIIISERFSGSTLIFMDRSRSEEGTGFVIYVPGQQGFGYHLQEPSGVFTAEITAEITAVAHRLALRGIWSAE
jgi:hypothetical protein